MLMQYPSENCLHGFSCHCCHYARYVLTISTLSSGNNTVSLATLATTVATAKCLIVNMFGIVARVMSEISCSRHLKAESLTITLV